MIPTINAISYQGILGTGRTKPCVFVCEDENNNSVGEYVVKLRANIDTGEAGLLREIVGSLLATFLNLSVPSPVIVNIDASIVNAIPEPEISNSIRKSVGLNFGSKYIADGYVTWPVDKSIPTSIKQYALDTFVFDMVIQNPDRRVQKPNLLWKDDQILLIDHESGFSFLLPIIGQSKPWIISNMNFSDHVFFQGLRHDATLNLDQIQSLIESIDNQTWEDFRENIPESWLGTNYDTIINHIQQIKDNLPAFLNEVRRVLI